MEVFNLNPAMWFLGPHKKEKCLDVLLPLMLFVMYIIHFIQ